MNAQTLLADIHALEEDLLCIGREEAEGHTAIGLDLGGNDLRTGLRQERHGGNSE